MLHIRGEIFFIPDARKFLGKNLQQDIFPRYLSENKVDVVVTTGPPHSVHLIGKGTAAQKTGVKWLADFRDPWTTIGLPPSIEAYTAIDQKT